VLTAAQQNGLRGAFRILQVVSTIKTDTFTTAASSYTDITGLSVSITPSATSSKVFVMATITGNGAPGASKSQVQLVRDSTAIAIGDAAGSRTRGTFALYVANTDFSPQGSLSFLDSPNTTSATTYKLQAFTDGAGLFYLNRSSTDTDNASFVRYSSTITAFEVSA
jgi:hypothetical protein